MSSTSMGVVCFPATSCRPNYRQVGSRLCISTNVQDAARFEVAMQRCRNQLGRVATYGDLFYLYITTTLDASYSPLEKWIGNIVQDNEVFYGNRAITFNNDPDMWDFEGTSSKTASRTYWCAHDRL